MALCLRLVNAAAIRVRSDGGEVRLTRPAPAIGAAPSLRLKRSGLLHG